MRSLGVPFVVLAVLALGCSEPSVDAGPTRAISAPDAPPSRNVVINGARLPDAELAALEQRFGGAVPDGRYWYDARCGAWGLDGGPTVGFTLAGLDVGGALGASASGGGTGVFINGRELHPIDVMGLEQLVGPVVPARYWLDADGNAGYEGGSAIANLRAAAQGLYRQGSGAGENYGGGGSAYGNLNTGIGVLTDGEGGAAVFTR